MITKRNGNGQTECVRCKEKDKFALTWDSFLYTYNGKPYCQECLFEMLEEYQQLIDNLGRIEILELSLKELDEIDKLYDFLEDNNMMYDILSIQKYLDEVK